MNNYNNNNIKMQGVSFEDFAFVEFILDIYEETYKKYGMDGVVKEYWDEDAPFTKEQFINNTSVFMKRFMFLSIFMPNRLYELSLDKNDSEFYNIYRKFISKLENAYELNELKGVRYIIENIFKKEVDDHYLGLLEEDIKLSINLRKYYDSVGETFIINDEEVKAISAENLYNYVDTDLTYEEWTKEFEDSIKSGKYKEGTDYIVKRKEEDVD